MLIGDVKGPVKVPERANIEPPKDLGLKMEKGEDAPDFDRMIGESNILRQAELEKEKSAAGGDFRLGETKNDREFRQQLEKVTGKKQDKAKNKLERDDYLNLLVTQLKYQDPSKPMEHYEMASQMAQFNTVEQLMGVNKVLAEMKKMQNDAKAEKLTQYLGKDIELQGNSIKLSSTGKANTARFELPSATSNVIVEIRDEHSKAVKSMPMGALQIGSHNVTWDGTNDKGALLPGGNYTFNILASSEDGKPMTAKTSYLAKVEGITDILSGGKLDTNVGPADPTKIIAIRNPEEPIVSKPNKAQATPYSAQGIKNANSEVQKPLLGKETIDGSLQNQPIGKTAVNEVKITEPIKSAATENIVKPFVNENISKPPVPENMSKPPAPVNYQDSKPIAQPKYGGPPSVAGINGRPY